MTQLAPSSSRLGPSVGAAHEQTTLPLPTLPATFGRDAETAFIEAHVDGAQVGGGALALEGEAGIGKTTLLRTATARAVTNRFLILRATGMQASAHDGYAGLHELLRPLLQHRSALPPRQRSALLTAFALEDGAAPNRLLVSLGALSLLEEAAAHTPALIVVDDLQWLDHSTVHVLNFLALRLAGSRVAIVAALRSGPDADALPPLPFERLVIGPLDTAASRMLLAAAGGDLRPASRERILNEASGNPLALVELPTALRQRGIERISLHSHLPTTRKLERAFLDQVSPLPASSRTFLTLAAAADGAAVQDVISAGRILGVGLDAVAPLERAGLLSIAGSTIRLRHPLLRSAVQAAATTQEWTAAHVALSEATEGQARSVWHRAAATMERNDDVAEQLAVLATRARERGAQPEATAAYRRAAALSQSASTRARRLVLAAETAREAGMTAEAMDILAQIDPLSLDSESRAQAAMTRGIVSLTTGATAPSSSEVDATLRALNSPADAERRILLLWCFAILARGQKLPGPEWDHLRQLLTATNTSSPLKVVALAALATREQAGALRQQLPVLIPQLVDFPLGMVSLAVAAESVQDLHTAERAWSISLERFHERGSAADEVQSLRGRAGVLLLQGKLLEALSLAEYAERLAVDTGQRMLGAFAAATQARAQALLGKVPQAQTAIRRSAELASGAPLAMIAADGRWAAGIIALSEHRYREALIEFSHVAVHPGRALWTIAEQTEAAVHAGRPEYVRDTIAAADAVAATVNAPYLSSLVARSRALLAEDTVSAEDHFKDAVRFGVASGSTLDTARAQLLYGEWLRRRRRPADARKQLAEARTAFESIGASAFAERTALELRAAGEAPRRADPAAGSQQPLTPQELQVARLAAQGLSNREIADRIYLSHRTVSTHLYKVYPKLGIAKRSQLAEALHLLPNNPSLA